MRNLKILPFNLIIMQIYDIQAISFGRKEDKHVLRNTPVINKNYSMKIKVIRLPIAKSKNQNCTLSANIE